MKAARSPLGAVIACAVALAVAPPVARAATITVAPNEPDTAQCFPFAIGLDLDEPDPWTPFAAFFYRDVPPFELKPGDELAFDLAGLNDTDVGLEIALARTAINGGIVEDQPFQTVVTNTQTPANPRGDTVIGNFELRFAAQAPFSFPGGGLISRFSNPSAAHLADVTCDQIEVTALSTDSSGFFVLRAFADADGVSPWDTQTQESIGGFRVTTFDPPPTPPPPPPADPAPPPDSTPPPDTDPPETTLTKDAPKTTA